MTKQTPKHLATSTLAALALMLALSNASLGADKGAAQSAQPANPTAEQGEAAATRPPTEMELESWRKAIEKTSHPTRGCFTATYPETEWREVPCKPPPNKPYPPKRPTIIPIEAVGGANAGVVAEVTGVITSATGSFDRTEVTSVCSVECPNQVCPPNPTCTDATKDQYTVQLNTNPFRTKLCAPPCQGWEQFIYDSSFEGGVGTIQYWLINVGKPGTPCPKLPNQDPQATCQADKVNTELWCPFLTLPDQVSCVINAHAATPVGFVPAAALSSLAVTGKAGASDSIVTSLKGAIVQNKMQVSTRDGENYFTDDLGRGWQKVEFNVFGDMDYRRAVFNNGARVAVQIAVESGTTSAPFCSDETFTGESNNLTLASIKRFAAKPQLDPSLQLSETNPKPPFVEVATCASAACGNCPKDKKYCVLGKCQKCPDDFIEKGGQCCLRCDCLDGTKTGLCAAQAGCIHACASHGG